MMNVRCQALALVPYLGLLGCSSPSDRQPRAVITDESGGALVLDWTIGDSKDPAACNQSAVSNIDVTVEAPDGTLIGEFQEDCRTFATTIPLPRGSYLATAVLIDEGGGDRTTPVDIDAFTIHGSGDLDIPIDFPTSSFR